MPNEKKIYVETLGCARNQVDSEVMTGRLMGAGWTLVDQPVQAHVIVVNTCSFIEPATNESIDTILTLAAYKHKGACRRLIVTGCLPERYREATAEALSEVDLFLGTGAYDQIVKAAEAVHVAPPAWLPDPDTLTVLDLSELRPIGRVPSVYVKIAEGCNRHCTYCIIPKLRGRQKSRPAAVIIREAQKMVAAGVKELVLVAQDSTHYGWDLSPPANLAGLLRELGQLSDKIWIRFLYGHPESIHPEVIEAIAASPVLLPYFDLPIQHAGDRILKNMGRRYGATYLLDLFDRIRQRIPEAVLRTTALVGFPGETEHDFEALMDFVRQVRFDHLGVFMYSDAEDLASHGLPDPVSPEVAQQRYDQLMALQMNISREKIQAHIGKQLDVLVEEAPEADLWVGRTFFQAPEVDGVTYLRCPRGHNLTLGEFIRTTITDAMEYDLIGEVDGSCHLEKQI